MFTGLIEEVGKVTSIKRTPIGLRLEIACSSLAAGSHVGDSVAVDGVCLTLTRAEQGGFEVEAVGDTLTKTTLRNLERGRRVNLERAMRADGRLGGHLVMGHVSGTARILSWGPAGSGTDLEAWFLMLELDPSWADRVVPEGAIAVDGISLTVAEVELSGSAPQGGRLRARISVIPHTRLKTSLLDMRAGDEVNVELDVLASYVRAGIAAFIRERAGLGIEQLKSWGYR